MRKSLPQRGSGAAPIGAAQKEAGRAFGFVKIQLPQPGEAVTRPTFGFQVDQAKRKAAEQRDGHYLLRRTLRGEDPAVLWKHYVQLTPIESAFRSLKSELGIRPLHQSTRASRRGAHPDCFPGLRPACDVEKPPDDSRAGTDTGGGVGKAGHDPEGGSLDRWWMVAGWFFAPAHPAGEGRSSPVVYHLHLSLPSQPAPRIIASPMRQPPPEQAATPAFAVAKTFG